MTISVLLVDDQPLLRTGFRLILASEPDIDVVGEAGDGETALAQVKALRPDVVLMDIRMPRMDGVESTRRIVQDHGAEAPRVLVLTTYDHDDYVVEALRAGASGFLLKDTPAEDLVDAVRVVHRGEAVVAPSVTRRLPSLRAPRRVMHVCSASSRTSAPRGARPCTRAVRICPVSLSWICSRRAHASTRRAILLRPARRRSGR